jgi:AbrB family looped-hinge helix DNA binding protein
VEGNTDRTSKIVKPLPKGQVTIPAEFRRRLGIDESTLLNITLAGDRLEIRPLRVGEEARLRQYSDEQIARFLKEDRIDAATARKVRQLLGRP